MVRVNMDFDDIVIGDNELQSDCAVLKNMQSGEQENIILSQPESWIEKLS